MDLKKNNKVDIDGANNIGIINNTGAINITTINNVPKKIDKNLNLVPNYDYRLIIDRIDITADIHNTLNDTPEIVIISGVGGIGKTTIALAYCNNPEIVKQYNHIAWVTVTDDLQNDLMNKLSNDETGFKYYEELSKEENFYNCLSTLSKIKGNNLLIIDNANNPSDILNNKEKLECLRWKVLITSRTRPDECKILNIEELELSHCRELFQRFYKKPDKESKILNHLLKHINYHTLLTELLAKSGNKNPILNIVKLYELIQKQDSLKEPLLQKKITISNPQATQKEIDREFKLYDYIIAIFDIETLNEEEKQYLRYFSILPYIEIPFSDLVCFFNIHEKDIVEFSDTLDDLVKKGWLLQNILQDDDLEIITYKCHQLIQTIIRVKLNVNYENVKNLIIFFISKIEIGDNETFISKKSLIPYCENIINVLDIHSLGFADLFCNLGYIIRRFGEMEKGHSYSIYATELYRKNNLKNFNFAKALRKLGESFGATGIGDYQAELKFKLEALSVLSEIDYFDKKEFVKTYSSIAHCYRNIGESEKAFEFYDKGLKIANEHSFELEISVIFNGLGILYSNLKQNETALEYRLKSLRIRENILPENHPDILSSINNIGVNYSKLNDYTNALKFHNLSLEKRILIYGEDHHDTSYAYNNIASVYRKIGKYELALSHANKALILRKKYLNENHPLVSSQYVVLSRIYFDLKEKQQAANYAKKAIEIKEYRNLKQHNIFKDNIILLKNIEFSILEDNYFQFRKQIKLLQDITPINLQFEKEKFNDYPDVILKSF